MIQVMDIAAAKAKPGVVLVINKARAQETAIRMMPSWTDRAEA